MNDNDVTIGAEVNIEFESVDSDLHCLTKRLQGVFRSVRGVPSMSDEGPCVEVEEGMYQQTGSRK
jgi:hypothetical protein